MTGALFWCGGHQWRCTDLGTRTVIAIRIDGIDVKRFCRKVGI